MMWTDQWIYFVLLVAAALLWLRFGPYPLIVTAAGVVVLSLWSRFKHPNVWNGDGYRVRVQFRYKDSWVDYSEDGRLLSFRAEWAKSHGKSELVVEIEQDTYLPPDYANPLSEGRLAEIQKRVSEGLEHLKIRHSFVRMPRMGWTSLT